MTADLLASVFKKPLDSIFTLVAVEFRQLFSNQLLEYQMEEYRRNYFSKSILHRTEPKPLLDFYQPIFIKPFSIYKETKKVSTSSLSNLPKNTKRLTIIGSAG